MDSRVYYREAVEGLIMAEQNVLRFEDFCRDAVQARENVAVLLTSRSHDEGRDARSTSVYPIYLQATTSGDSKLDAKAKRDIEKISRRRHPERMFYCSTLPLSESKVVELESEIRALLPNTTPVVMGAGHLADYVEHCVQVVEQYFHQELATLREKLFRFAEGTSVAPETHGLRLALLAFDNVDARVLRAELTTKAVIDILEHGAADIETLATKFAAALGISASIDHAYVESILEMAHRENLVVRDGTSWKLTEKGTTAAQQIPRDATRILNEGRIAVKRQLEEFTELKFQSSEFEKFWSALLDFLSDLFYTNGMEIVTAIGDFVKGTRTPGENRNLEDLLREGAKNIARNFATPEVSEFIEEGVVDIFTQKTGSSFEWLSRVCERFVCLCTLGLEGQSADEIRAALRQHVLSLDSDIVITLLCQGEPNHSTVRELLGRWRQLGGRIEVSKFVLTEVAHHAWVSERDFRSVRKIVEKLSPASRERVCDNAFVRTFFTIADDPKMWNEFISEYRGSSDTDYSNILSILQDDLGVIVPVDEYDRNLQTSMTGFLTTSLANSRKIPEADLRREDHDKAFRDGQLMASIAKSRKQRVASGKAETDVVVSSYHLLQILDAQFRAELGDPDAVIPIGVLSLLICAVPTVRLGSATMRRALFSFGEGFNLQEVGRLAMKVIEATNEYRFPFSRRRTLQAKLKSRLHSEAKKLGMTYERAKKQFVHGGRDIDQAALIVSALKDMVVSTQTAEELAGAQKTIAALQSQIEKLQTESRFPRQSTRSGRFTPRQYKPAPKA